jgi:hypothetical protein
LVAEGFVPTADWSVDIVAFYVGAEGVEAHGGVVDTRGVAAEGAGARGSVVITRGVAAEGARVACSGIAVPVVFALRALRPEAVLLAARRIQPQRTSYQ